MDPPDRMDVVPCVAIRAMAWKNTAAGISGPGVKEICSNLVFCVNLGLLTLSFVVQS